MQLYASYARPSTLHVANEFHRLRHFYFIDIVFEQLRSLERDFTGLCCRGFIEFFATQEFFRLACPSWYLLVMQMDLEWSKKLTEPNQAIVLHIVKNRGGEKGKLAFDFFPSVSRFNEV